MARAKKQKVTKAKPVPTNIYVVIQYAWEYNDEYYYQPTDSPGEPVAAYFDSDSAQRAADKLNINSFLGGRDYTESPFDHFGEANFDEIFDISWEDWSEDSELSELPLPSVHNERRKAPDFNDLGTWWGKLTDEQKLIVIPRLNLRFYDVRSVPLTLGQQVIGQALNMADGDPNTSLVQDAKAYGAIADTLEDS